MSDAAISIENLTLGYDQHPAVHHLDGQFAVGSLTAIVGPNGAGKSTLLQGLMGLLAPLDGHIDLGPWAISDFGFLPQQAQLDISFPISVLDTVCLGFYRDAGLFGGVTPAMIERARTALREVGLEGFEERPSGALSRGQFQRVLFARLMVQDAALILLDEPFTAIDDKTCADLLAIIHGWHRDGRTVIAVLHDYNLIRGHFPDTLLLARECLAWGPTSDVLSPENLSRAHLMSQAWAEDAPVCVRVDAA
ncbi:MAG: metal ABC transporter ATP-binding protein [Rhodospirillales bacterium]|nr:metal ABC transporter ATP-binding protein [Rhodospirillales bacterium]